MFRISWNIVDLFSQLKPASNDILIENNNNNTSNITRKFLEIKNPIGYDIGNVECIAENIVGRVSAQSSITINAPPSINDLSFRSKFYWCISYNISGVPPPKWRWYFNGKPLNKSDNIQDAKAGKLYRVEGCLQFKKLLPSNEGNYTLVVYNSYGNVSRTINVDKLKAKPASKPGVPLTQGLASNGTKTDDSWYTMLMSIAFIVILIFIVTIMIYFCRRSSVDDNNSSGLAVQEKIPLNLSKVVHNPNYFDEKHSTFYKSGINIIKRTQIKLLRELGEGAFGRVFLGTIEIDSGECISSAIKTLKDERMNDSETIRDFEREAKLLTNLNHDNIVKFHGISIDGEAYMMIFEYMKYGDLNNFLCKNEPNDYLTIISDDNVDDNVHDNDDNDNKKNLLNTNNNDEDKIILDLSSLINISLQIALGLEYLKSQHFVHRDLATRNCLVGENLKVKISDFGMSRNLYTRNYYKLEGRAMLPLRWMSPEAIIYGRFTHESDLWSYGIVLWEIFTYGKRPFYTLTDDKVLQTITEFSLTPILEKPKGCPESIYFIMKKCWTRDPNSRIDIFTIKTILEKLISPLMSIQSFNVDDT